MKRANNISVRVFVYPEEDYSKIKETFFQLIGMNEEKLTEEKIEFSDKKAKGFGEKIIRIISIYFEKDRHCNAFLKRLKEMIPEEEVDFMINQKNRIDEHLNYFIRLDKKSLLEEKVELTDSGDCFHIKINVAAFPRKKEIGYKLITEIFSKNIDNA